MSEDQTPLAVGRRRSSAAVVGTEVNEKAREVPVRGYHKWVHSRAELDSRSRRAKLRSDVHLHEWKEPMRAHLQVEVPVAAAEERKTTSATTTRR